MARLVRQPHRARRRSDRLDVSCLLSQPPSFVSAIARLGEKLLAPALGDHGRVRLLTHPEEAPELARVYPAVTVQIDRIPHGLHLDLG